MVVGIALAWYGFSPARTGRPAETEQSPLISSMTPLVTTEGAGGGAWPTATSPPVILPTDTPPPSATPEPTAVPPTAAPLTPLVTAGVDGANVRTGPGLSYDRIGYLDPGVQAEVTGRYGDWWQILYGGGNGWVYGEIVTAQNTDAVPEVVPPPAPTAPPAPPTVPPTAAPTAAPTTPPSDLRGLVVNNYWVEGAPGPYGAGQDIWFNFDVTNGSGGTVEYVALGTWVEETGQYQKSWTYSAFDPGQQLVWRDHLSIPSAGAYNLWLMICFDDGVCTRMRGPVAVTVQ
ncbi:MAG: SH3 domain-containing protein [Anaerolineae bacterium]|nr:SH3 domain-containing protein [Anaerolineae bacterium]